MDRSELVVATKNKIYNEVTSNIAKIRNGVLTRDLPIVEFEYGCKLVALYTDIRDYINDKHTFMDWSSIVGDTTNYYIKENTFQMWLQDDFDWCWHWKEAFGINFVPVSDLELELNLTTILEKILFDEKFA